MKLGIITHYHNSKNYGGLLQAYALCRVLHELGHACEQICFEMKLQPTAVQTTRVSALRKLAAIPKRYLRKLMQKDLRKKLLIRAEAFRRFRDEVIPHSQQVYDDSNIADCATHYDGFVTGSDQVWNPIWYQKGYMLDFVPAGKKKLSYAASIGQATLNDAEQAMFRTFLASYDAVSVREESAVNLLQEISPVPVHWVLDPTLLLSAEQWNAICAEPMIQGNYVFCYFLGEDARSRELARMYSKEHNLKLVTLPYLSGRFSHQDLRFGDIRLFDVSPDQFISLIKHADMVFTDSFHASVFSNIYNKDHFTFQRQGHPGMNGRIHSLCSLFGTAVRFCDTEEKLTQAYIRTHAHDSPEQTDLFSKKYRESYSYLTENLQ